MPATLRVDLPGRLRCLERLLAIFHEFAAIQKIPAVVCRDAHVALDEIVSNVIYYGSATGRPCRIQVETTLSRGVLRISVTDNGRAFNPLRAPRPRTHLPPMERPIGGVGIALVRHAMDRVAYSRLRGRNRLVMTRAVTGARRRPAVATG